MSVRNLPVLVPAGPGDEARVRRGFWPKLRRFAGRVPFMEDAVAAYFCTRDPATPRRVKAVLVGALAYFVVPTDLIPDFIAGLGLTDDATVLMAAVTAMAPHVKARHRRAAQRVLDRLPRADDEE